MFRGCITVLMLAAVLVEAQQDAPVVSTAGEVSIPAELTTTVRAENAHRGDPVEFRTLEPVLITNGVVMPANAKLQGRIVGAAPQRGGKPSWLVLLVERAVWKKQTVSLHAFIAGQITISNVAQSNSGTSETSRTTTSSRRASRESARAAAQRGIDMSSSTRLPEDSSMASQPTTISKSAPVKDLRMIRDKDGIYYLFSTASDIKLPSGALFVLKNQTIPAAAGSAKDAGQTRVPGSPQ